MPERERVLGSPLARISPGKSGSAGAQEVIGYCDHLNWWRNTDQMFEFRGRGKSGTWLRNRRRKVRLGSRSGKEDEIQRINGQIVEWSKNGKVMGLFIVEERRCGPLII